MLYHDETYNHMLTEGWQNYHIFQPIIYNIDKDTARSVINFRLETVQACFTPTLLTDVRYIFSLV